MCSIRDLLFWERPYCTVFFSLCYVRKKKKKEDSTIISLFLFFFFFD